MRFQDAARDGRAVVYAGIQADPLVRRAAGLLGWQPRHSDLDTIIRTAWAWHRRHAALPRLRRA